MYLEPTDVVGLLAMIADHVPGAVIFFDTIPPIWTDKSAKRSKSSEGSEELPKLWGVEFDRIQPFLNAIPGVRSHRIWTYSDHYPDRLRLYTLMAKIPFLQRFAPGLVLASTYRKSAEGYAG